MVGRPYISRGDHGENGCHSVRAFLKKKKKKKGGGSFSESILLKWGSLCERAFWKWGLLGTTFVSKALWYRTFKKRDCSLIWNFFRMYQSIRSSNCKFHEKNKGQFFARDQNQCTLWCLNIKVIAPSIMPISLDLHVKCPFCKKWNKKKMPIFFSWNFHTVFGEKITIFYQIFKSGSSKKKNK